MPETTDAFYSWVKSRVQLLSGIDLNAAPLSPPTTEVFEWSDSDRAGSHLCA